MWLIFSILSIILAFLAWYLYTHDNPKYRYASSLSLIFMAATLLAQYRIVLSWVTAEDWIALSDVVPSSFTGATVYTILLLLLNLPLLIAGGKQEE